MLMMSGQFVGMILRKGLHGYSSSHSNNSHYRNSDSYKKMVLLDRSIMKKNKEKKASGSRNFVLAAPAPSTSTSASSFFTHDDKITTDGSDLGEHTPFLQMVCRSCAVEEGEMWGREGEGVEGDRAGEVFEAFSWI